MKIKVAPNDVQSMSQDGESILRSLQNKSLPEIDLIVREGIQNSLDASIKGTKKTRIDFKVGSFNPATLASHFNSIEHTLKKYYFDHNEFISISDKDTYGLTGDYKSDDPNVLDNSNFHKLVFGIGKNQDKEGAGGSWGLGKTSFFRIGIGLVIYYTRVKVDNVYEERLIASLIENPNQENRLLDTSSRGIAWWGELDELEEKIYPITDLKEIKEMLHLFGLENYKDSETGTTIIIPYINPNNKNKELNNNESFYWQKDKEEQIKMAVQRWYFPRIMNKQYSKVLGNSYLECRVNNELLMPHINFENVFDIYQKIYTAALLGESTHEDIKVKEVKFAQNVLEEKDKPIGYIAFKEVSKKELDMFPPNNKPSGLAYLGVTDKNKNEQNNSKVVAYSRRPGMIIEYSVDGPWTPSEFLYEESNLLLGFFVPVSNSELNKNYNNLGYRTVENYLRSTENSDHANWMDQEGVGIINRMKKYSAQAIKNHYFKEDNNSNITETSGLSRKYGELFMPPKGFGKTSKGRKSEKKWGNKQNARYKKDSYVVVMSSQPIDESTVGVNINISIKNQSKSILFLQVITQDQKLDAEKWTKSVGSNLEFPFTIGDIYIYKINGYLINDNLGFSSIYESYGLHVKKDSPSNRFVEFQSTINNQVDIEATLKIKMKSKRYQPNMAIKTIQ